MLRIQLRKFQKSSEELKDDLRTWQEAENFCVAHNGHLASVHNAFDMTSLRSESIFQLLSHCLILEVAGICTNFWLGGQCQAGSNCKWVDGTDFDDKNFRNGNQGSDNCVVADTKSGMTLQ